MPQCPEPPVEIKALALPAPIPGIIQQSLPFIVGVLASFLLYGLLPQLGVDGFQRWLTLKNLLLLFGTAAGIIGYAGYLRFLATRLTWLLNFYLMAWPLVEFFNYLVLIYWGINIHLRPLIFLGITFPIAWHGCWHARLLFTAFSHIKYYLAFFGVLLVYSVVYNAHATDHWGGVQSVWSEGDVAFNQTISYFNGLMAIVVAGLCALRAPKFPVFFDHLNRGLLLFTAACSLITIVCYPLGQLSTTLDGFHRASGFFTHPNPFAHHMGVLLLYQLGLYCYYQARPSVAIPRSLLYGALALNLVAFLLGLSKTGIGVFTLAALIILSFNLSSPRMQQAMFKALLGLAILIPLGLFVFQVITDTSFFDVLQARIDQRQSLDWRTSVWLSLWNNMEGWDYWVGHGFTSANAWVFQMTFNDNSNAKPLIMVHNGYIALLYDFGVLGYLFFCSVLSLIVQTVRRLFASVLPQQRALLATVLALSGYFLTVCAFDEMTYMFDAPLLFWCFTSLLIGGVLRLEAGR